MPGTLPAPPDHRPSVEPWAPGHEIRTLSPDGTTRHTWRQVGWHGQTGAIYGLGEKPQLYEPGSFSPLYVMVDSDRIELPSDVPEGG